MEVYNKLTDLTKKYPRLTVALGMFDGVHIGHQSIISRAVELAKKIDGKSVVFTFSNHPLSVLAPQAMPPQIGNNILREKRLEELGVDILIAMPFTKEFASRRPEEFLEILRVNLAPYYVVTGPNYTFGYKGKGTQRMLLREGNAYGFTAEICPAILRDGRPVSSTRVRSLLAEGDLHTASDFLGYPFTLIERVIHGDERGRVIGFPTANLAISEQRVMLPNGVYAVGVKFQGKYYNGVANIGNNPTFAGCNRRIEVNIDSFHGNLYDKLIGVEFLEKLRDEVKFSGVEQLVKQIKKDKEKAKTYWRY
ncbi:bifunctional riboflavin kinase/FAD synthetase [Selenomonas ruminantium]|uniref:Riboflavin biosynthesis protein n=1 Tax=Selenomonas ruminantium TaxID=971 RepID=A0A1K1MCQ8_SELRU|nr:bifunctional riboflavin kinase/FAD synthetase [Selenomonas ruminantium]SFW20923.1 riboflavin kinase / FMN adenylyltransferase [Selenomonas ruminantium]